MLPSTAPSPLHEASFVEYLGSGLIDITQSLFYPIIGLLLVLAVLQIMFRPRGNGGGPRLISDEETPPAQPPAPAPPSHKARQARASAQRMQLEPAQRRLLAPVQDLLDQVHDRLTVPDRLAGDRTLLTHRLEDLDEQIAQLVDVWERLPQTLRHQPTPGSGPHGRSPYDQSLETLTLLAQGAGDLHSAAFAADLRRFDEQNRYAADKFRKSELD